MKIKYSPCKWNPYAAHNFAPTTKPDTEIKVISDDILQIDGEMYEFSPLDVQWPDIHTQTDGIISEAHREDGELYVTMRRFYTQSCCGWDTAQFHDVQPEMVEADGMKLTGITAEQAEANRIEEAGKQARAERDRLLAESDWTQLPDAPKNKDLWAAYRQALRDIPQLPGFPDDITWPGRP